MSDNRAASPPQPPAHLGVDGRRLWVDVAIEYSIDDPAGLALLTVAGECLDRMRAAQRDIKKHGLTTKGRYGQRVQNPAVSIERDARAGLLQALRNLNLDLEPLKAIGRPPGGDQFQRNALGSRGIVAFSRSRTPSESR